ncbi:hypothetical protein NESM_000349500 [Novymonas esmeraldas]|uniref:Uncharacterized protein n=1 Tax=Novymonas esmeraldas TaxID=1808958 RepID=A0AAW0EJT3_9TRYP
MGSEPSKHSSSSAARGRSRERRRSGLSNALAGGDCRSGTSNERSVRVGPTYGDAPDYIPPSPVRCSALPIQPSALLAASLTWIADTEAALIVDWNRRVQEAALDLPGAGRTTTPGCGGDESGCAPASTAEAKASGAVSVLGSGASTAALNTPGLTSSTTCPPPSTPPSPTRRQSSGVPPLSCDCVSVEAGRSTGTPFPLPTAWSQAAAASRTHGSTKAARSPTSPKQLPPPRGDAAEGTSSSPSPSLVVTSIPVGMEYFRAVQSRWLAPAQRALPPATEEEDLNDSAILEAVAETNGDVLSPPVPLGYMIDLYVPQWRSEGLYEAAQENQTR